MKHIPFAIAAASLAALIAGANFAPAAYDPWPTGTAGTPNARVLSVQGVTGGVALPVSATASNPSSIYSHRQTTTTSAVALPSQALVNGIVITANAANAGTVYVGPSGVTSSTGYPLAAGQSISYAVADLSSIYIIGTNTTDVVAFTGN